MLVKEFREPLLSNDLCRLILSWPVEIFLEITEAEGEKALKKNSLVEKILDNQG